MIDSLTRKKREGRASRFWLLLLFAHALQCWSVKAQEQPVVLEEYSVKAALLFNIAKYTDWPAAAFARPGDPIVIGVLGDDPFGEELDRIVKGRSVNGRSIAIRRANGIAPLEGSHLVFVSASQPQAPQDCVALEQAKILTVGDTEFSAPYTAFSFAVQNGKVGFSVDLGRSQPTGAVISSKLLKLATSVKRAERSDVR